MSNSYCIVIVTFNRLELLKECLYNALHQTRRAEKIVIVDNCSTDGTYEFLDNAYGTDDRVIICHEKENIGGAGGFHDGLKFGLGTRADWLLLIDDDAILELDCMEKMDPEKRINHAEAYACSVMVDGDIALYHRRNKKKLIDVQSYSECEFKCELASFCGLMVSRNLVGKIGLPIKDYFIWYDDTEYSLRITKYSNIIVVSKAKLNHKIASPAVSEGKVSMTWKSYYGTRNMINAFMRHRMYLSLMKSVSHYSIIIIKKCLKQIVKGDNCKYEIALLRSAIIDGLLGKLGKNNKYLPGSNK